MLFLNTIWWNKTNTSVDSTKFCLIEPNFVWLYQIFWLIFPNYLVRSSKFFLGGNLQILLILRFYIFILRISSLYCFPHTFLDNFAYSFLYIFLLSKSECEFLIIPISDWLLALQSVISDWWTIIIIWKSITLDWF